MADYSNLPDFDSLPKVEGMPQGCAWGIFDKDGKKDHLGCLNLLTPAVVKEAVKEVQEGISVSLNCSLALIETPGFARKGLVHNVLSFMDSPNPALRLHGYDDEVEFNTQASSQWDSLAHFTHQATGLGYNGVKPTVDSLRQPFGKVDLEKAIPTLNHWHERGGLVGRGVLLDYRAYAVAHDIQFNCFDNDKIYVEDLEKVAEWEGVQLRQGDILIVRTGFTEELASAKTGEEQQKLLSSHRTCGVYGSVATAKWFWNHHFAAVAGDAIAFEQVPPTLEDGSEGAINQLVLHQYFLSLFGLNIGELWDLKELSKTCAKFKRYSFLITSIPLNIPGAVGSPPNALAIF
ncbi:hypothetical protein A1O7_04935 [Cladophialophora yegresii CBS 114405]|uniref:Cyclase n=1 Tax=Cladophialophora yegresii CBS 114405 TaxID=1182544 RepID=W9VY64_9EURO|nr:uncharacterized protein A1O7_04935 [Cladophialophora yegresii CBS 114405]EXJ60782.1 hypothetical protein A1O7_04935 [Cladophialophora yegresii CBS 114405]